MGDMQVYPIIPILEFFGFDEARLVETERWKPIACMFHDESNASASYIAGEEIQAFRCHACPAAGNAVTLLMQQLGLDAMDAIAEAERITGVKGGVRDTTPKRYKPVKVGEARDRTASARPAQKRRRQRRQIGT